MPSTRLKAEILAARTRRQAILQQRLPQGSDCLLQLSLNIPGADKTPRGTVGLYRWGEQQLNRRLPELRKIFSEVDLLGPWGLYGSSRPALETKRISVAIEESQTFARLLDIDVYPSTGQPCDRHRIGLGGRTCLLCHEPANQCARLQRHSFPQLEKRLEELLKPFTT